MPETRSTQLARQGGQFIFHVIEARRDRQRIQLGSIELEVCLEQLGGTATLATLVSFIKEHLLHPEACCRAVEIGQERKMVVLGRLFQHLDSRRRLSRCWNRRPRTTILRSWPISTALQHASG